MQSIQLDILECFTLEKFKLTALKDHASSHRNVLCVRQIWMIFETSHVKLYLISSVERSSKNWTFRI